MRSDNPSWFGFPFARLWNRSAPNSDRPVAIIGPDLSQPQPNNIDIAIVPRGTGSISLAVPDGASVGGNKRGNTSIDLQLSRVTATQVASGTNSALIGGSQNTASGSQSVALGGSQNTASGSEAVVLGGNFNTANASGAVAIGGSSNTASQLNAAVGGGGSNTADGSYSVIPGGHQGRARGLTGRLSLASGSFTIAGDAQYGLMVLRRITTNTTPLDLTSTNAVASSINIPVLPDNSLYAFRGQVVCIQAAGAAGTVNDCKTWDVSGSIKRGAGVATTALLGTPTITVMGADTNLGATNAGGAIIAITADTTNGGLLITVTGETDKTLRWVATIHTTEVDY